eukprot:TRINITY_DN39465_c0_g1_i1.p1 TRINITY_DN39465_c0_g1~~TRINITY_DN39465_c0_g1_i1.p1  ORF type:complete len:356 (+),score=64.43 TRINITY_DN39465_c0_g1_i1:123-1190(+)
MAEALLRAAGAVGQTSAPPGAAAGKGAPAGMVVYVVCGGETHAAEVGADATAGDVMAQVSAALGRTVARLSYQGTDIPETALLADEGIGAEAVLHEEAVHEAKWYPGATGENIELRNEGRTATRIKSFMKSVVCTARPIHPSAKEAFSSGCVAGFELDVDALDDCGWAGSLTVGVLAIPSLDLFSCTSAHLSDLDSSTQIHLDESFVRPGCRIRVLCYPGRLVAQAWRTSRSSGGQQGELEYHPRQISLQYVSLQESYGDEPLYGAADIYGKCGTITLRWVSPGGLPPGGPPLPTEADVEQASGADAGGTDTDTSPDEASSASAGAAGDGAAPPAAGPTRSPAPQERGRRRCSIM